MKPAKPKNSSPPPRLAPREVNSARALRELQRVMADALMRPLTARDRMQRRWNARRTTASVVSEFIKPNDRLTSFERLEIYNRQYWFRVLDCLHDDFPGLRAVLGPSRFHRFSRAYLERHPSTSFTLRDLGRHLPAFLSRHRAWAGRHAALAVDMARFEWAQVEAFDGLARPVVTAADLASANPATLRLGLQPYVSLLALGHAVDDFALAVKQHDATRGDASHAVGSRTAAAPARRPRLPGPERVHLAVHRRNNILHYKRLSAPAFQLLTALRQGLTVADAVRVLGKRAKADDVRAWFEAWSALGWFCAPSPENTVGRFQCLSA